MFKFLKFTLILSLYLVGTQIIATEIDTKKNNYFLKLSIDNNFLTSYDASTDMAYSSLQIDAYLNDACKLQDNILSRVAIMYSAFFTAIINHEVAGHGFRAIELGATFNGIGFKNPFAAYASITTPENFHIQKDALISLGGNEVNYLLGQKISDRLIANNQMISPVMAAGYLFSQGNQFGYVYLIGGGDISAYIKAMQSLYDSKSLTYKDITSVGWIDLLDPIMLASIYSVATGKNVEVPKFSISENISITPFAKSILTPYGIIEKKIGSYIFTPLSPIKLSVSFGSQSKTKDVVVDPGNKSPGKFTGLNQGETINNPSSYGLELSIFKLIETKKYNLGLDLAFWHQPELFLDDTYRAEAKSGFMVSLNNAYKIKEDVNLTQKVTYKTKGFLSGHKIDQDFSFSVGFEVKL